MASKIKQSRSARPQEYQKQAQDYEQKLLDVSRVARVTAGGRRFSFRAVVVIGNKAGKVGVGVKKGKDVQFAVEKAVRDAKKSMLTAPITENGTIPYEIHGKCGSSVVFLKPAKEGIGIRAGGAARTVCDLAGYRNIVGKILSRSRNKLNIARATMEALMKIRYSPERPQNKEIKKARKDADTSTKTIRRLAETKKS